MKKTTRSKTPPPRRRVDDPIKAGAAGRPRVYATELPVYDSMEQCSSATGVPLVALRIAKKGGSLFVRHGRVHFSEFIRWWFNQPETTEETEQKDTDWSNRDKRAAALLKEVKLEEAKDRVIDFALVEGFVNKLVNQLFFGELERIQNEFPAALKGKGETEIAEEVERQTGKIKAAIVADMQTWIDNKGKAGNE